MLAQVIIVRFVDWFRRHRDMGQSMVEYALILALVTVVVIVIIMVVGNQVKNLYCNISGGLGS